MEALSRNQIAWRAAQDLEEGSYVNLGLGLPVLIANYKPTDRDLMFHSENGIVGVGPVAGENEEDPDFVDAGSQKITLNPGAALFDSSMAFAMIRGGHLDVTLLGGFEVSETGDLANWDARMTHKGQLVGGAMDLVTGAKSVRVTMQHTTKTGEPAWSKPRNYPLTGVGTVDRVYGPRRRRRDAGWIRHPRDGRWIDTRRTTVRRAAQYSLLPTIAVCCPHLRFRPGLFRSNDDGMDGSERRGAPLCGLRRRREGLGSRS